MKNQELDDLIMPNDEEFSVVENRRYAYFGFKDMWKDRPKPLNPVKRFTKEEIKALEAQMKKEGKL